MTEPRQVRHSRMATCPQCSNTWGGRATQHCPCCHETFTGTTAGDAHRLGNHNDGTRRCHWPADRGLVLRERAGYKVWGLPTRVSSPHWKNNSK